MSVLLLRLSGPMQSWGVQGTFTIRETGREPSKSGVAGLLCAALGRPRSMLVDDLAGLRMAVRVDVEGIPAVDFQTARRIRQANAGVKFGGLSWRHYLANACFLVGLEGDDDLIIRLNAALQDPRWPLCLGRKSYIPGEPVWLEDGLRSGDLLDALRTYPWLGAPAYPWITRPVRSKPDTVRVVVDDPEGDEMRVDYPVGTFVSRQSAPRRVRTMVISSPPAEFEEEE